jgi:hypothetical protein
MTLVNLIAYVVVFGLPIWLVTEEVVHRLLAARKVEIPAAPVPSAAPAATSAGLERRAPEGAHAHASFV